MSVATLWADLPRSLSIAIRDLEVWLKQIPVEVQRRKFHVNSREGVYVVTAGVLVVTLLFIYAIAQARVLQRAADQKLKKMADEKLPRTDSRSSSDISLMSPEVDSPYDSSPAYVCEGNADIVYVANRLSSDEFVSEGRKATAEALKQLYADDEFRNFCLQTQTRSASKDKS